MMALNRRGRHYRWNKKDITESYQALDMATFAKAVDLTTPRVGSWLWTYSSGRQSSISYVVSPGQGVRLSYTSNRQDYNYLIKVDTTTPHYGGVRYWWLCPHCGRRVRILYGGSRFLCRHCHNLTYETAQAGKHDFYPTIDNRLYFIRRKLQGKWHFLHGPGEKPKGMHWDTYGRLVREYFNLLLVRNQAFVVGASRILGDAPSIPAEEMHAEWQYHKAHPDRSVTLDYRRQDVDDDEQKDLNRLTLGEIAQRAGVPYAFALEAQQFGLIRADQGRGKRRRRYRERLKNWLHKLHTLRSGGMSWEDITAWSKRRFQPGHEDERGWPAGIEEKEV